MPAIRNLLAETGSVYAGGRIESDTVFARKGEVQVIVASPNV